MKEELKLNQNNDDGADWTKKIKYRKCRHLFKPFYFGDKPLNRNVSQDFPWCGEINAFVPAAVDAGPPDEYVEGIL